MTAKATTASAFSFFGTGVSEEMKAAIRPLPVKNFAHKMRRRLDAPACMAWQKCAAATVIGVRFSLLRASS